MPRPKRITQAVPGVSLPVPLDHRASGFNVTLSATINAASTYAVEMTTDDVQAPGWTPASGNWVANTDIGAAATADKQVRLESPMTAVRLNVASGNVSLDIIHAG